MMTATAIHSEYREAERQIMQNALTACLTKWRNMALPPLDKDVADLTTDERFAILVQYGEEVETFGIEIRTKRRVGIAKTSHGWKVFDEDTIRHLAAGSIIHYTVPKT